MATQDDIDKLQEQADDVIKRNRALRMAQGGGGGQKFGEKLFKYSMFNVRQQQEEQELKDALGGGDLELDKQPDGQGLQAGEAHRIMTRAKMRQTNQQSTGKAMISNEVAAGVGYETTEMILEEVLDTRSKNQCVHWFKTRFKIYNVEDKVTAEKIRRRQPDFRHPFPRIQRLVAWFGFDVIFGAVMIANSVTIGIVVSNEGTDAEGGTIDNMEHAFVVVFLVEILLRVMSDGWTWIWSTGNIVDTVLIIGTGAMPLWVLAPSGLNSPIIRSFACLRVVRLVRIIKLVRTWSFVRDFWMMIQGLGQVTGTLSWTIVLLFFMCYIFSVFAVYAVGGRAPAFEGDEFAMTYFRDVPTAMVTTFQIACLDNWSVIARPLMKKSVMALLFMVAVIAIINLVLLNLITAVIVKNTFKSSEQDEEMQAHLKRDQVFRDIEDLCDIFTEIDTDGSGMLSYEEYTDALLYNERCMEKFREIGISEYEQKNIWKLIADNSGPAEEAEVSIETFSNTLRALQGNALAKDSFTIARRTARANTKVLRLIEAYKHRAVYAQNLKDDAKVLREELGSLMQEMAEFCEMIGDCVPDEPANRPRMNLEGFERDIERKIHMPENVAVTASPFPSVAGRSR